MINEVSKKDKKYIFILSIILTMVVLLPLFFKGIYRGHDLQFHISRIDGIVQAIQDHQFPIALYPYKNFGYGYASPLFYSDLFLIIPAIIYKLFNLNIVTVYKAIVFVFVELTAFTTIYYTYKLFGNLKSAFLASIVVLFSNYYLTDLYIRCALGEIIALSFLPFLFFNIYVFIYHEQNNYIELGIGFALLLYSHIITFVLSVVVFGILLLMNYKSIIKKERIIELFKAMGVGILLSLSFLAPMLEQYMNLDLNIHHVDSSLMQSTALSISDLFTDVMLQFKLSYNNPIGLAEMDKSKTIGIVILVVSSIYLIKKNKYRPITQIFALAIVLLVMSTKYIPLYKIAFLDFIQFPSRLFIICIFLLSFVIAYTYKDICNNYLIILVAVISILNSSFLFVTIRNDEVSYIIPENVTAHELFVERKHAKHETEYVITNREEVMNGEYLPYSYEMNYAKGSGCIDYLDYSHAVCEYERSGTHFKFSTNFNYDSELILPISYYIGYKGFEVDNQGKRIKEIDIRYELYSKRVLLEAPSGIHHYEVEYSGTMIQKVSLIISSTTSLVLVYNWLKKYRIKNTPNNKPKNVK